MKRPAFSLLYIQFMHYFLKSDLKFTVSDYYSVVASLCVYTMIKFSL